MRITVRQLKQLIRESVEEAMLELNEVNGDDDLGELDLALKDETSKEGSSKPVLSASQQAAAAQRQRAALQARAARAGQVANIRRSTTGQVAAQPPQPAANVRRSTPTGGAVTQSVGQDYSAPGMQNARGNRGSRPLSADELALLGLSGQGGVTRQTAAVNPRSLPMSNLGRSSQVPQPVGPGTGNVRGQVSVPPADINMPAMNVQPRGQTINMPAMNVQPRGQTINMPAMDVRPRR